MGFLMTGAWEAKLVSWSDDPDIHHHVLAGQAVRRRQVELHAHADVGDDPGLPPRLIGSKDQWRRHSASADLAVVGQHHAGEPDVVVDRGKRPFGPDPRDVTDLLVDRRRPVCPNECRTTHLRIEGVRVNPLVDHALRRDEPAECGRLDRIDQMKRLLEIRSEVLRNVLVGLWHRHSGLWNVV